MEGESIPEQTTNLIFYYIKNSYLHNVACRYFMVPFDYSTSLEANMEFLVPTVRTGQFIALLQQQPIITILPISLFKVEVA